MSGALSKRQQARNERALQDLIKAVPGNNVCADCQARNPGETRLRRRRIGHVLTSHDRMGKLECKHDFFHVLVYISDPFLSLFSWVYSCVCGVLHCIGRWGQT